MTQRFNFQEGSRQEYQTTSKRAERETDLLYKVDVAKQKSTKKGARMYVSAWRDACHVMSRRSTCRLSQQYTPKYALAHHAATALWYKRKGDPTDLKAHAITAKSSFSVPARKGVEYSQQPRTIKDTTLEPHR